MRELPHGMAQDASAGHAVPPPPPRSSPDGGGTADPAIAPATTRPDRFTQTVDLFSDMITPKGIGVVLAALLLLVTWIFGGLESIAEVETEVPVAEVGADIDAAPFTVSVTRARWVDELDPIAYASEGERYILLLVNVTSRWHSPVPEVVLNDVIRVDAPGVEYSILNPKSYRGGDALPVRSLQPGVPTEVVIVYAQDASEPPPTEVTVDVGRAEWKQSMLDETWAWFGQGSAALVTLPLEHLEVTE